MYDIRSKLSPKGKITEVLGNNTYLADCGKGPQHVSGDVISRVADVATRTVGGVQQQTVEVEDTMDPEDSVSVVSDSSTDSEAEQDNVMAPGLWLQDRRRVS